MQESLYDIARLFHRQLRGEISPEEQTLLQEWLASHPSGNELLGQFAEGTATHEVLAEYFSIPVDDARERTVAKLFQQPAAQRAHRIHFLKTAWFRYAAAIILIVTGVALYYTFSLTSQSKDKVVQHVPSAASHDIPPGFNRAILTLSNGQKVELDSAASETINDGNLAIENINGILVYGQNGSQVPGRAAPSQDENAIVMNTMTTPNGGQYKLTLADGTKVWLNAASSITYPASFKGKTREVSITGEAYFEVKQYPSKPFVVKTPAEDISVLGTEFNVNAYSDEMAVKTSLLKGSVRVGEKILKPGQAFINGNVIATDIEQDVAWKNGLFNFQRLNAEEVLRQLARWYDVQIEVRGQLRKIEFRGRMPRTLTLQQVLRGLEGVGNLHFNLQNNKLIVTQT